MRTTESTALASVVLSTKATAALIGWSEATLRQCRLSNPSSRPRYTLAPPATRVGERRQGYALADVLEWAEAGGRVLQWHALPWSFALVAGQALQSAGLQVPAGLNIAPVGPPMPVAAIGLGY